MWSRYSAISIVCNCHCDVLSLCAFVCVHALLACCALLLDLCCSANGESTETHPTCLPVATLGPESAAWFGDWLQMSFSKCLNQRLFLLLHSFNFLLLFSYDTIMFFLCGCLLLLSWRCQISTLPYTISQLLELIWVWVSVYIQCKGCVCVCVCVSFSSGSSHALCYVMTSVCPLCVHMYE